MANIHAQSISIPEYGYIIYDPVVTGAGLEGRYRDLTHGTDEPSTLFEFERFTFTTAPVVPVVSKHYDDVFRTPQAIDALLLASEEAADELDLRIEYVALDGERTVRQAYVNAWNRDSGQVLVQSEDGPRNFRRDGIQAVSL